MKLFVLLVVLFSLASGCNRSKESQSTAVGNVTTLEAGLPLQYQLTDNELKELKSDGLLSDSNINEIKKFNK